MKCKPLDLFEDTDVPCARGHQGITRSGHVAAPSDAVTDGTARSQQQQTSDRASPIRAGNCLVPGAASRGFFGAPSVCSRFGHMELLIVLLRNSAAELRTEGQEEMRALLTPSRHCSLHESKGSSEERISFQNYSRSSETKSSSHTTSEALLLTIPIPCTFQRSISSCQAPLGLPLSRKTHQP